MGDTILTRVAGCAVRNASGGPHRSSGRYRSARPSPAPNGFLCGQA